MKTSTAILALGATFALVSTGAPSPYPCPEGKEIFTSFSRREKD